MKPRRLPWPDTLGPNTPLNRRETIARAYRDAALSPDPVAAVEKVDRLARAFGEVWPFPIELASSQTLSTQEFADMAGVSPRTVDSWYGWRHPAWGEPPLRIEGQVMRDAAEAFLDARDDHNTAQTKAA